MNLDDASRLLIALAACDWVLTAMLLISAKRLREASLTERATASVILSVIATIAALLAGSRLGFVHLENGVGIILLVAAFVLVSAPQFIWAIGLLTGRFR